MAVLDRLRIGIHGQLAEHLALGAGVLDVHLAMDDEESQRALVVELVVALETIDLRAGDLRHLALVGVQRGNTFGESTPGC